MMMPVRHLLGKTIFLSFFLLLSLWGIQTRAQVAPLSPDQAPELQDDLNLQGLETVLTQNLRYLQRRPAGSQLMVAGTPVPVQRLINSTSFLLQRMEDGMSVETDKS